jgi:hypothetical protein
MQALTPATADAKTAIIPSPVVLSTCPSAPATAAPKIASWRSRARFMAPGNRSQSRVLPSTSVNKKVKVPDAGSACTALASQHHLGFSECP